MECTTVGKVYNRGKAAHIYCRKNAALDSIEIKDNRFMLVALMSGKLTFERAGETVAADAPCFICFDENENPTLISNKKAIYYVIYFNPDFLNINMTFERLRDKNYGDFANAHDMFLLKPFIERQYVIPICDNYISKVYKLCGNIENELNVQRDWYWSCRSRSYFMELIIALERMYGLIGYGERNRNADSIPSIKNNRLHDVILFIEGNYMNDLSLADISDAAGINHTTLTRLIKQETGYTAMEYLYSYRVKVAKKHLAFTELPIKDIASRCGFKTVQHFGRVFLKYADATPAEFRRKSVQERKADAHREHG